MISVWYRRVVKSITKFTSILVCYFTVCLLNFIGHWKSIIKSIISSSSFWRNTRVIVVVVDLTSSIYPFISVMRLRASCWWTTCSKLILKDIKWPVWTQRLKLLCRILIFERRYSYFLFSPLTLLNFSFSFSLYIFSKF